MAISLSFLDVAQFGALLWKRRDESGGNSSLGCIIFLVIVGVVAYLIMKNRGGSSSSGPLPAPGDRQGGGSGAAIPKFVNPYDKCPSCAAKGDKMKSTWDGMRKVQWTCGYCGTLAGVQELKDEELPASAKARLGIGQPQGQNMMGGPGYQGGGGGGVGGLLTGMMIGSMLGGNHHDNSGDGGFGSGGTGGTSSNADWGESGSSGWGDSGSSDSSSSDSGGGWGDFAPSSDRGRAARRFQCVRQPGDPLKVSFASFAAAPSQSRRGPAAGPLGYPAGVNENDRRMTSVT